MLGFIVNVIFYYRTQTCVPIKYCEVLFIKEINLTHGKIALVNNEMYDELNKINWYYNKNSKGDQYQGYANAKMWENGKRKTISMHRYIMRIGKGSIVDHIDGNTLNNQINNLRVTTQARNLQNTYKNKDRDHLYYDPSINRWISFIQSGGNTYIIGEFKEKEEAEAKWHEVLARKRTV
jgi:hypothetical protein